MKLFIYICSVFFLIATLFQFELSAQDKRFVAISPSVGGVIDSMEAIKYGLFQTIEKFHSATFYRAADNSLGVLVQLKSAEGKLRDSTFAISPELVKEYIKWIGHVDEMIEHVDEMIEHGDEMLGTDTLPLAPNKSGLLRPIFETIRFDVSFGYMQCDFSELKQLIRSGGDFTIQIMFYIQVPLFEEPSIFFLGGWGFSLVGGGGGSVSTSSSFLLYKPSGFSYPKPFVGLGIGYTSYDYGTSSSDRSHGYLINASESYPIFIIGLNIVPNILDIMFTYPLAKGINKLFESKSYNIKLAGPGLSLLLSF